MLVRLEEGTIVDCYHELVSILEKTKTFVAIFHAGTNNVNKSYFPEKTELNSALSDLENITQLMSKLREQFNFAVVFSGGMYTKKTIVNVRLDLLNVKMKELCNKYNYVYIDNSNISQSNLKDMIHLYVSGEALLVRNLHGLL